jgi:hypothetical protein
MEAEAIVLQFAMNDYSAQDKSKLDAYYSVISRAVSRLPNNTREARAALYDRAGIVLSAELQQDPGVSGERVAVEHLAFEKAVRKVESEARKRERYRWLTSFLSFSRFFKR